MKSKYTIPKLNKASKYWYVHYRYEGEQFRETNGLNKIEDLKVREQEYNNLCKAILIDLENGFNPNIKEIVQYKEMYFVEAVKFALGKKESQVCPNSYSNYKGTVKFVESAAEKLNIDKVKITDVKRKHIKLLMDEAKIELKWTNKTFNRHLFHLKILLTVLVKWDIIEANPATTIDSLKVDKTSLLNAPASETEIETIKKTLIEKDFNFYIFCITIFHTGIRPAELLKTTLKMINLERNEFNLPATITKNKTARTVPINKHLKEYFIDINFSKFPKDYYLFGSFKSPGIGKKKKENKLIPDFLPGPTLVIRKTASMRWDELVKVGLGIKMNLYAMKHYGADKKILAGMNMDSLRELYGHSSKLMTEKYAKIIKEVYRKDIMDNSPDF